MDSRIRVNVHNSPGHYQGDSPPPTSAATVLPWIVCGGLAVVVFALALMRWGVAS